MESSGSSASSIPELIREHVDMTRSISAKGLDQSSILECLNSKMNELVKHKERIFMLESQLKMAQDGNKLRDAEYAFQASQYETEIAQLKQRESDLLEQLSKKQMNEIPEQKSDIDSAESEKHQKWKERSKELQRKLDNAQNSESEIKKENDELKVRIHELENQVAEQDACSVASAANDEELRRRLKKAKSKNATLLSELENVQAQMNEYKVKAKQYQQELKQLAVSRDTESDGWQQQIDSLIEEKEGLEEKLKQANTRIIKQQVKLDRLNDEHSSFACNSQEQMLSIEQENTELKVKTKSMMKQLSKMQNFEELARQQKEVLEHVELERDNIADILGIEVGSIADPWSPLTQKLEKMVSEIEQLQETKTENEKLQRRLDAALDDSRRKLSGTPAQNATSDTGEYAKMLAHDLRNVRMELQKRTESVKQLTFRQMISSGIESILSSVASNLHDLHSSICGTNNTTMRPMVLAVIFSRRLLELKSREPVYDIYSLQVYSGRDRLSIAAKIREIREMFVSLTQDLMLTKQSLSEAQANLVNVTEERDIAQLALRSNSDETKLANKKVMYVQKRMKELQEELSSLVSPDTFNEVCHRMEQSQKYAGELEAQIKELQQELETRTEMERQMTSEMEELRVTADQRTEIAREVRTRCASKEEEVESLKSLLREKTREILSLERLVQKHQETESSARMTLNCLAVENQELNRTERVAVKQLTEPEPSVSVNPSFLGM